MITYISGDIFRSPASVLVNAVNTVGVMGKGIAKDFKRLFPEMFRQYRDLCESGRFDVGNLFLYKTPNKWILNFPTKKHWRSPSRPEYIERGLNKLVEVYLDAGLYDLAMPLLGCGHGELDWPTEVQPIVEKYLKNLSINVFVYSYPTRLVHKPEHRDIAAMEKWLRSEPENLPFSEVWKDIVQILERKNEFLTSAGSRNMFEAFIKENPQGIVISINNKTIFISYSELADFWHQLRCYGFTFRQIAPSGLSRRLSYLMPIFAELDYVMKTNVSESYRRLHNGTKTIGLQYWPQPHQLEINSNTKTLTL